MQWVNQLTYLIGVVNAFAIMLGGLVVSLAFLLGKDVTSLWHRVWPAALTLIGTSGAGVIILMITRRVIS